MSSATAADLPPDIGDRGDFPISSFGERSQRPGAVARLRSATAINLQPQVERVGFRKPRLEQAGEQRILAVRDRSQRARAIHRQHELVIVDLPLAAPQDRHVELIVLDPHVGHPPGDNLQPADLDQPLDPPADLRRDPVAVNVPPWPGMAQEALLVRLAQNPATAPGCAAGGYPPLRASRPQRRGRAASATGAATTWAAPPA